MMGGAFFQNALGMCTEMDHMMGHTSSLDEYKKIEIIDYFENLNHTL